VSAGREPPANLDSAEPLLPRGGVVAELRQCLAELDALGLAIPANHVSLAIDLIERE
jgi:hypothetical protein